MEKIIRFRTWKDLLSAVKGYEKLGIKCEVRGWNDMRNNRLTINDEWVKEAEE